MSEPSAKGDIIRVLVVNIGRHYFGAPIAEIHDVIQRQHTTAVPLSPPNVVGLLNLRGHIVTEIDMARTLNIHREFTEGEDSQYSIVINQKGELYSLVFDDIGDVIDMSTTELDKLPETIDHDWQAVCKGVYRQPDKLLVILDLGALIHQIIGQSQIAV